MRMGEDGMSFSPELIISVVIQLIAVGIFIGVFKTTVAFMQQQIIEIKDEMKKYNNVLERLIITEQAVKSAHKRLDTFEETLLTK